MAISKKLPVHAIKKLDMYFQLAKSVLTKERQDQLKFFNSILKRLCKGLCTQGAVCVHARTEGTDGRGGHGQTNLAKKMPVHFLQIFDLRALKRVIC